MRSLRSLGFALVILSTALGGCYTATGAALGGAAGHAIGHNDASTAAGAVVGGVVGHEYHERHE